MATRVVLSENLLSLFTRLLGKEKVKVSEAQRLQFSKDEGHFRGVIPSVVLEPTSVEEVSAILKTCNDHKLPVVPFGTGTGLEGGSICTKAELCLSLMQIKGGVTSLHPEDFDCSVRPSVTRVALNEHIRDTGLFFPDKDPGADASVCGMVATGASGTNAVRYGTMKQNVLNMEVVLADGTVVNTRGKNRRPRLHPRPTTIAAAVTSFPTIHDAVSASVEVLQCAIPIARIELLDDNQIAASNSYSHTHLPVQPHLFLEFHGASQAEVSTQSNVVGEICKNNSATSYNASCEQSEMEVLWKARHNAYYAALALRTGAAGFCTDVCVPITRLTMVVEDTKRDLTDNGITGTIVGHVGDGNFHVILPVFKEKDDEMDAILAFSDRLVKRALEAGGTCTGEHGIGLGKIKYLEREIGPGGIAASLMLKKAFDPHNILNPGKVLREWI